MSDIRTFKMVSGDEIIGRVEDENDKGLLMSKVRVLATFPVGEGQVQLQMIPFTVSNPECSIRLAHAAFAGEIENPAQQLVDGYMEQTTGIALA